MSLANMLSVPVEIKDTRKLVSVTCHTSFKIKKNFDPPFSISSRTHITNKPLELRVIAGIMEKLRYKISIKKAKAENKLPYNVLSSQPYRTEPVTDYRFQYGATYTGPFGPLGTEGYGKFVFKDGIIYHGNIQNNMFSGKGTLTFPNGAKMKAVWIQGVAFNPKYIFSDGFNYQHKSWGYCTMPDRRFLSEYENELKPSGNVQLAHDHPARAMPHGSYDNGEGFYNPHSRELIHPITGKFIRIPSEKERQWILNNCRREWIAPLPFDPDLYENWFPEHNKNKYKQCPGSLWKLIDNTLGDRIGMEGKIKHITGIKTNVIHTNSSDLVRISNALNRSFKSEEPNNKNGHSF